MKHVHGSSAPCFSSSLGPVLTLNPWKLSISPHSERLRDGISRRKTADLSHTSDQKNGSYAMVVLYRSDASSGDAKRDFDADWKRYIVGIAGVTDNPQMEPQKMSPSAGR